MEAAVESFSTFTRDGILVPSENWVINISRAIQNLVVFLAAWVAVLAMLISCVVLHYALLRWCDCLHNVLELVHSCKGLSVGWY